MKKEKILFVTSPDSDLAFWCIWYKCTAKSTGHTRTGYGRDRLLEYIPEGTRIYITPPTKEITTFILRYNNKDHNGPATFSRNLNNTQYLIGLIQAGAKTITI